MTTFRNYYLLDKLIFPFLNCFNYFLRVLATYNLIIKRVHKNYRYYWLEGIFNKINLKRSERFFDFRVIKQFIERVLKKLEGNLGKEIGYGHFF